MRVWEIKGLILAFCILTLLGCERTRVRIPSPQPAEPTVSKPPQIETPQEKPPAMESLPPQTYAETVSRWKSHQDLVRWMENEFSFDRERFRKYDNTLPSPRTAEETFKLRSGIYIDAALFAREVLNRISPSYKAQIVIIILRPYGSNHYVCSFRKDGKIFILDYGTPYKQMTGVHGPYDSLAGYKAFYEKNHPVKKRVEAVVYWK